MSNEAFKSTEDSRDESSAVCAAQPLSQAKGAAQSQNASAGSEVYDWLTALVSALVFCVVLFAFFIRIMGIIGPSMMPSLFDGDRVVLSNLFYEPKQGDIVILRKLQFDEEPIVKRVIAVEGQTVDINFEKGIVYVDDEIQNEPYILEPTYTPIDFEGRITVPEGQVFVMGDNRNNSSDSRLNSIGCVDRRYIIGKLLLRVFPISSFQTITNPHNQ